MKVLVDTNILLDFILERGADADHSAKVIASISMGRVTGYVASITINNIWYIGKKSLLNTDIKEFLNFIVEDFTIVGLNKNIIQKALEKENTDFEDSLQYYTAKEKKCDYIITRDKKGFKKFDIGILNAKEFSELL